LIPDFIFYDFTNNWFVENLLPPFEALWVNLPFEISVKWFG